jgi:hypothetical protein
VVAPRQPNEQNEPAPNEVVMQISDRALAALGAAYQEIGRIIEQQTPDEWKRKMLREMRNGGRVIPDCTEKKRALLRKFFTHTAMRQIEEMPVPIRLGLGEYIVGLFEDQAKLCDEIIKLKELSSGN